MLKKRRSLTAIKHGESAPRNFNLPGYYYFRAYKLFMILEALIYQRVEKGKEKLFFSFHFIAVCAYEAEYVF